MSKVTEYRYPNAIVRIHEDKPIQLLKFDPKFEMTNKCKRNRKR